MHRVTLDLYCMHACMERLLLVVDIVELLLNFVFIRVLRG